VLEASIVVIGDEILGGYVVDTNSPWLARKLGKHGIPLTRIHVVADEPEAIDEALQAELARSRPRIVFTSGGIGSTPDDLTYEAVAASLDRELVLDPTIAGRIEGALSWTREQGIDVTEDFAWHLQRMARIPAGSRLLREGRGWVPGVAVDIDGGCEAEAGASVLVLPGVPSEFRAIVEEAVEPDLLSGRNEVPSVVEIEHSFPESVLNLTFVGVLDRFPGVKVGSYPGRRMLVRLVGPASAVEGAAVEVRRAIAEIEASPAGARLAAAWAARSNVEEEGP
jgi:molybdenum cofactor synthesis domain-containing protein